MVGEARTMSYLHDHGYPVPAVQEVSDDGFDLVMERVDGPTMVEELGRAPWRVRALARMLAELHKQLHEIVAPDFLPVAPVGKGDRVLHLDLHPLNVLLPQTGPVVIDWTGASRGDPTVDVGLAWALMASGDIPGGRLRATFLGWGRSLLVNGFIGQFDRQEIARLLPAVVEWKSQDANMGEHEVATMRKIARLPS
jgi:aminoglycoside phosphotransferase (APT) family kinase protein